MCTSEISEECQLPGSKLTTPKGLELLTNLDYFPGDGKIVREVFFDVSLYPDR
jgi:hypothetical protein